LVGYIYPTNHGREKRAAENAIFNVGARQKPHPVFKIFLLRSDNPVFRAVAFLASTAILQPVLRAFSVPRFWLGARARARARARRGTSLGFIKTHLSSRALASGSGLSLFLSGLSRAGVRGRRWGV
jgi:hypothetical protein